MTTIRQARESIYQRFKDNWTGTPFTSPEAVTFDNEAFTPPTVDWVRLAVRNTSSQQETLGRPTNRNFLRQASVFVQIFTQTDAGMNAADDLAQEVRTIFEGVTFDNLRFTDVVTREEGPDGLWFMVVVECFFDYNEHK